MDCNCNNTLYTVEDLGTDKLGISGALERHKTLLEERVRAFLDIGVAVEDIKLSPISLEINKTRQSVQVILTQTIRVRKKS